MKRWLLPIFVSIGVAVLAGELLCRWPVFRDLAGRLTGRGRLVTIVNGKGIYETDLGGDEELTAADAALAENLGLVSANEKVEPVQLEEMAKLLEAQFSDARKFEAALRSAGLTRSALREKIDVQLRAITWLEKRVAAAATDEECRTFYDRHPDLFTQPVRYRVSHLFLAAHAETPPEAVEEKEKAIGALAARLAAGEPLFTLAAEASEDEATKPRGGDLGYFSEKGVPPEFLAEIQKLRVGETSQPFRSPLGFHIAQLTDLKPARLLRFEEARPEISLAIANERRALEIAALGESLRRTP